MRCGAAAASVLTDSLGLRILSTTGVDSLRSGTAAAIGGQSVATMWIVWGLIIHSVAPDHRMGN